MSQPNRLPADAPHGWGGGAIDRSKPLSFKLDGRSLAGFAGDTLLSALLANGITSAGSIHGAPMALDGQSPVFLAPRGRPELLLPVDRTPLLAGLDLVTAGAPARKGLLGLFSRFRAASDALTQKLEPVPVLPWLDTAPAERLEVDLLVVGGGIAGLAAARAGKGKVLLVERRTELGGDARFYGTIGDETPPDARIAQLTADLSGDVLLGTEVFWLADGLARAHQVRVIDGRIDTRVVEISAGRIVLATGAAERLPVFAGNRLPGVTGAIAAFHLADRFGVWPGKRLQVSTPASEGYRLGLLAADAGLTVQRIADTRLGPSSRFIDFCKASGVPFTSGLLPRSASLAGKDGTGLLVSFALAIEEVSQDTQAVETDRLIAAGGRQPDLSLWLMAGGRVHWQVDRFLAEGELPDVALAGAAAGLRRSDACVASGEAAARGKGQEVEDDVIDSAFETPAAPTPLAPPIAGAPAYLALGRRLTLRPDSPEAFVPSTALNLGELAALVQLGALSPAEAGRVAGERVAPGADILDSGWKVPVEADDGTTPAYFTGRFGAKPQLCHVTTADARFLTRGSLVFLAARVTDPLQAVGTIVGPPPGGSVGGTALLSREVVKSGDRLFVRDAGGAVALDAVQPL